MEKNKQNVSNGWLITGGIVILLALANPFFIMFLSNIGFTVSEINQLGTVGDFFGGTTVGLLSLASIFFVIHTIGIQRKELESTREEFKTGNTTAKVQQIDNAFFNMLSLHHQIVNNIKITAKEETYTGREAIATLTMTCKQGIYKIHHSITHEKDIEEYDLDEFFAKDNLMQPQEELDEAYKYFHNKYGNDIGHYMRFNYRIVKFIVNNVSNTLEEQKQILNDTHRETIIGDRRYYFGLLRAQWSNAEFELILMNSLYSDNRKFKNLILKHDVLDMEDTVHAEDSVDAEVFKLKESMSKFKAYRQLIEVEK